MLDLLLAFDMPPVLDFNENRSSSSVMKIQLKYGVKRLEFHKNCNSYVRAVMMFTIATPAQLLLGTIDYSNDTSNAFHERF